MRALGQSSMHANDEQDILDEDLSATLKPYLPADARTTVECKSKS
jgi:hypothetical protein